MSTRVHLKNVRIAFPKLFKAEPFEAGGEPRFTASFLIPKGSELEKAVEAAIVAEAQAKFGKTWEKSLMAIRPVPNKCAWQDGDLSKYESNEGHMILNAVRKEKDGRPLLLDRDKTPLTKDDGRIYAGCYVNASVDVWAQTGQYSGIRCSLNGVQFVKDGDAFGGAARVSDDEFEDLGVDEEADALVG
jgi:hypothetical protein